MVGVALTTVSVAGADWLGRALLSPPYDAVTKSGCPTTGIGGSGTVAEPLTRVPDPTGKPSTLTTDGAGRRETDSPSP